jgi:hypothetical protein
MLTLAQKGLATASIEKIWGFVGNLAAVKPEILDKMDADDTVDEYGDALGVSPRIIISTDDANKTRQARQQQAAAEQAAQASMAAVQGAKTLSETDVGGGKNALATILGNENV